MKLGGELEHADRFRPIQSRRLGIDRAKRAEEAAVRTDDRRRDVALEAVERRGGVATERLVLGHVVDDHRLPARPYLVADGRLDLELAARLEAERDVVLDRAGDPAILGDPRHGGEAHARGAAHHVEDRRHHVEATDGGDVPLDPVFRRPARALAVFHLPATVRPRRERVTRRAGS